MFPNNCISTMWTKLVCQIGLNYAVPTKFLPIPLMKQGSLHEVAGLWELGG